MTTATLTGGVVHTILKGVRTMSDLDTFLVNPWSNPDGSKVARVICDIFLTDGSPFAGCPRLALKRQVERAAAMGYTMVTGPEAEFFLFHTDDYGETLIVCPALSSVYGKYVSLEVADVSKPPPPRCFYLVEQTVGGIDAL